MATITKGKTFINGELVTPASIHQLVDSATISGIVNADISTTAAIADSKLAQITTIGKVTAAAVAGTAVVTADSRLSDARTPASHTHGNITNAGAIGTTATLPVITGASGVLQAGSFGTTAGTFCQGTDARLSDARTPTSHTHGNITNTGAIGTTAHCPVVTGASGQLTAINSGSGGQVLSSGGGSSAPFWANPVSSGSTVISSNNIANTVVQRDNLGSFSAGTVISTGLNVQDSLGNIMFAVAPSNIGNLTLGLPNVGTGVILCDFFRNGIEVGKITTSGTSGVAYNTTSDYRLKTNLEPLSNAVARLLQIPTHRFNWIANPDGDKIDGFLAHEAQAIVPESVTGHKDEVDAEGKPVHQGIDQSKLVPLLVAAVQELAARVAALEAR